MSDINWLIRLRVIDGTIKDLAGNTWINDNVTVSDGLIGKQSMNFNKSSLTISSKNEAFNLGKQTDSNLNCKSDTTYIGIDGDGVQGPFIGYLDEIRISNIAIWTDDFTPPMTSYHGVNSLYEDKTDNYYGILTV